MKLKKRVFALSNHTMVIGILAGVVCAFLISLLFLTGMTSLIMNGKIADETGNILIFASRTFGVLAGVVFGTGIIKDRCLITSIYIVLGYLIILVASCILIFDGVFCRLFFGVISAVVGGALGCLIRLKLQNGRRRTRINRR